MIAVEELIEQRVPKRRKHRDGESWQAPIPMQLARDLAKNLIQMGFDWRAVLRALNRRGAGLTHTSLSALIGRRLN